MYKNKQKKSCNLKILKYKLLNIVKYSRNFEFKKRINKNFITQNLCHVKDYPIFEEKRNCEKQCQKEVIYECTLAFAEWWSIFGWWWVLVDIFWLVVCGGIV